MAIKILREVAADIFDPDRDDPRLNDEYLKSPELNKEELRDLKEYDENLQALDPNDDRVDDEIDLNIDELFFEDLNVDEPIDIVKTKGVGVRRN